MPIFMLLTDLYHYVGFVVLPEDSARTHIEEFVKSATPVVEYVNNVFVTNELGTDW